MPLSVALSPLSAPRLPCRCEDRTALCVRAFPSHPHPRHWAPSSPGTSPPVFSSPLLSPVTKGSAVLRGNGSCSGTACAAHCPEVGLPAERGKRGARCISWASQDGGQDTTLERRLMGTLAYLPARGHLHTSCLRPCSKEKTDSGCALLCQAEQGATVPLRYSPPQRFSGLGETCCSQRGLLFTELCNGK